MLAVLRAIYGNSYPLQEIKSLTCAHRRHGSTLFWASFSFKKNLEF